MKHKDKYGRYWNLPKKELCPVCGQPDSCGDCDHKKLPDDQARELGAILEKKKILIEFTVDNDVNPDDFIDELVMAGNEYAEGSALSCRETMLDSKWSDTKYIKTINSIKEKSK